MRWSFHNRLCLERHNRNFRSWPMMFGTSIFLAALSVPLVAQNPSPGPDAVGNKASGMYEFLREGEFVELTVEDDGRVTGFISRYQDSESDHGTFLDHFLEQGKLQSSQLSFRTETVQAVWYEFKGTVDRGPGKKFGDEGYYVLKGVLTEHKGEGDGKSAATPLQVNLKSFPQDADAATPNAPPPKAAPPK